MQELLIFLIPLQIILLNQFLYVSLNHPHIRLEVLQNLHNLYSQLLELQLLPMLHDPHNAGLYGIGSALDNLLFVKGNL